MTKSGCQAATSDACVAGVETGAAAAGKLVEYCKWETFNASCRSPDHVIVMRTARYGRMRFGR